MESWLVDVKKVRIPRPKFGSGARCCAYPIEPPKDYVYEEEIRHQQEAGFKLTTNNLSKATEELRRAFQQKL